MQVTVYATTTCPYCNMLSDYLKDKNVSFEKKFVDESEEAREEMVKASGGFLGVPFTVVEKDGSKENIIGFDKGKLEEVLGK